MLGVWIENERNRARMPGGEADKNALPSTTDPFGNCLAILKVGIQNINRTVKGMGMWMSRSRAFDTRKQSLRGESCTVLG